MKKGVAFFFILILLVSCQGIAPMEKPDNLIPLEKMEDIVYDLTIINAARGYNIQLFSQTGLKPESHIFEKYDIDSLQYATSIVYYSADVEEYKQLIMKVQQRVAGEFKVVDSINKEEKRIKDSIRGARGEKLRKKKDSIIQAKKSAGRVIPKTVIEQ